MIQTFATETDGQTDKQTDRQTDRVRWWGWAKPSAYIIHHFLIQQLMIHLILRHHEELIPLLIVSYSFGIDEVSTCHASEKRTFARGAEYLMSVPGPSWPSSMGHEPLIID